MLEVYRDLSRAYRCLRRREAYLCVQMLMSLMQDLLSKILMYYVSEYSRRLDGEFELYEDDNESCGYVDGRCVTTAMKYSADKDYVCHFSGRWRYIINT